MMVTRWVEFSKEIDVHISAEDIRVALSEAFARASRDIDDHSHRGDVTDALNAIGNFLSAMTDEHMALLKDAQRKVVREFLAKQGARF